MKIIIVGCGKVGEELAAVLSQEKNDVTIIDKNEQVVKNLCDQYDIMGVVGNGASYSVQLEADIIHADLMIAVTGYDELNLLSCLIARKAGNCHTIARVRNPEYNTEMNFLKEELGLAMVINQEQTAAREIARVLRFPSAIEIDTFAKGRVELLRFKVPEESMLDGISLIDLHAMIRSNVLVCTAERGKEIIIPNGDYVIKSGDVISVVCEASAEHDFFRKIGLPSNQVRSVIIVGGGEIAFYLAQMLLSYGMKVKMIEKRMDRCEELSDRLPKVTVVHGDGSNRKLLEEEDLESADGFVALSNIDEENVILSLYAKKMGTKKIVTKINHINFDEVIDTLDLGSTIYPRQLTAEYILQYVRARKNSIGSNVETLHRIVDKRAEALEFIIRDTCSKKDIPLQDLPIKKNCLVACIRRKGELILPRGKDVLKADDTVIIVTTEKGLNDISDIFETK